jgi:hypothetical protein
MPLFKLDADKLVATPAIRVAGTGKLALESRVTSLPIDLYNYTTGTDIGISSF